MCDWNRAPVSFSAPVPPPVLCLPDGADPADRAAGNQPESGAGVRRHVPVSPCGVLRGRGVFPGPDADQIGLSGLDRICCRPPGLRRDGIYRFHLRQALQTVFRHVSDLPGLSGLGDCLPMVFFYRRRLRHPRHSLPKLIPLPTAPIILLLSSGPSPFF